MSPTTPPSGSDATRQQTAIASVIERFLRDKGKGEGGESGSYRRDAKRELGRFVDWCRGDTADDANASPAESWRGIAPDVRAEEDRDVWFSDLNARVFGDYARYLRAHGFAQSTVNLYYAYIASFSEWATREGYLPRHYARMADAERHLPDGDEEQRPGEEQSWKPQWRNALTQHVDREANDRLDALDETDPAATRDDREAFQARQRARYRAIKALRDRALAYTLAFTGLRGAEFLDEPRDDRDGRNGLLWREVSLPSREADGESGYATVYRKKQQWDQAALPPPVATRLHLYRQRLNPPETWPVFPTFHKPTLSQRVTAGLTDQGHTEEEVERIREDYVHDLLVAAAYDIDLPAMSTKGARSLMERLTEAAGIADELEDDKHGYLAPHGGRRGAGEVFVREFGMAEAARYLDNTEEVVKDAYQHIDAAEQGEMAAAAFRNQDGRVGGDDATDGPEAEAGDGSGDDS
jgi:integrase